MFPLSVVTDSNIETPLWQGINLLSAGLQFKESTWYQRSEEKHIVSLKKHFSNDNSEATKPVKEDLLKTSLPFRSA